MFRVSKRLGPDFDPPVVLGDISEKKPNEIALEFTQKAQQLVPDIHVMHEQSAKENSYTLSRQDVDSRVTFSVFAGSVFQISIDGVDTTRRRS